MDTIKTEFLKEKLNNHYSIIEKSVKRRFPNDPEQMNETLSFVSEKLVEDNMRRLALYAPEKGACFETYFTVLVQRLISRFMDRCRKNRRFPKWINQQENFLWQMVYKLVSWEGCSDEEVIDYLKNSVPGTRDERMVRDVIQVIRSDYPDCGKNEDVEAGFNDETLASHSDLNYGSSFHHLSPEDQIAFSQVLKLADTIFTEPVRDEATPAIRPGEMTVMKSRLHEHFNPSPEKRLFLKMIYVQHMSVSKAGRMLGWNANQAAGHHRRLMAQLHNILGDDALI